MKLKPLSCALLTLAGLAVLKSHGLSSAQEEEGLHQIREHEGPADNGATTAAGKPMRPSRSADAGTKARTASTRQQQQQQQPQPEQQQQQQQQQKQQKQQKQKQQRREEEHEERRQEQCKLLDVAEGELVYSQLEAEDSNNDLLSKAYGIINSKLDGVTSMSLDYGGQGQNRKVGKWTATATITRVGSHPSGQEVAQCFSIPYEITDTDECRLEEGHPMRHKCHRSTVCVNTVGSYECGCAKGYWGEEDSGSPSLDKPIKSEDGECGGQNSTAACCGRFGQMQERRAACVEDFKCTSDPCKGHTCDENSWCSAGEGYRGYECTCKDGFKKDDRGDCVRDVRVAVNHCKNNTCPYHCRCSVEGDSYRCEPRHGYRAYIDGETLPDDYYDKPGGGKRLDKITRCVDKRTPDFSIKGPNPVLYRQGDTYEELGVKVDDQNDDESERKIKMVYSKPPGAYLKNTGEFTVRYVLQNRLLEGDGTISKIRKVQVIDVDECTYTGPHVEFRHACAPEATCHNTDGSYECRCAKGYAGDGLTTGQGCVDVTPPTITCKGAGCRTSKFRACNCVGMVSEDGSKKRLPAALDDATIEENIKLLKADICGQSDRTPGAAGHPGGEGDDDNESGGGGDDDDREWKPEACFAAVDMEYGGKAVDLSRNITRGALEKVPGEDRTWRVPHYVKDAAGNSANVFYYNIAVEEVDVLDSMQLKEESLKKQIWERDLLRAAVVALLVLLLSPHLLKVLLLLKMVLAAAKVVFFPYSMLGSRESFVLGYGFLLRVKAMGMGSSIERRRKIQAYWASLVDQANSYDDDVGADDS